MGLFDVVPSGDEFIRLVSIYRALWIAGRPGGGKTSLAVYMAFQLVKAGFATGVCVNMPLNLPGWDVCEVKGGANEVVQLRDVVIILDEAWGELGSGADKGLRTWMAYPRKNNQYLLFPSVLAVVKQLQAFSVERVFNGYLLGLPFWMYRYRLVTGTKDNITGVWYWMNPKKVFPYYDHLYRPSGCYWLYRQAQ